MVIMSNDNVYERLYKLQSSISKMVLDGKRNPVYVADSLQRIMEGLPCGPISSKIFRLMSFAVDPKMFGEGCTFWMGPLTGDGLNGEVLMDKQLIGLMEIDFGRVQAHGLADGCTGHIKYKDFKLASDRLQLGGTAALSIYYDLLLNRGDSRIMQFKKEHGHGFAAIEFFGLILRNSKGLPSVICLELEGECPRMYLNPLEKERSWKQHSIELLVT